MVEEIINRSLSLAFAAESKNGKSTIGAMVAKEFKGFVCDFSRVDNKWGSKTGPKFTTAQQAPKIVGDKKIIEVGEAWTACQKVGLEKDRYKLILSWADFENVVNYARMIGEDIDKKKEWLVLDDTVSMRKHKVNSIAAKLGHQQACQADYRIATIELQEMITNLSREFNLLLINQMKDEWAENVLESIHDGVKKIDKEKQSTGKRVPNFIPNGTDYLCDGMGHIEIDRSQKPFKQYFVVDGGREIWICDENFEPRVSNVTAMDIMKAFGISEDRL